MKLFSRSEPELAEFGEYLTHPGNHQRIGKEGNDTTRTSLQKALHWIKNPEDCIWQLDCIRFQPNLYVALLEQDDALKLLETTNYQKLLLDSVTMIGNERDKEFACIVYAKTRIDKHSSNSPTIIALTQFENKRLEMLLTTLTHSTGVKVSSIENHDNATLVKMDLSLPIRKIRTAVEGSLAVVWQQQFFSD